MPPKINIPQVSSMTFGQLPNSDNLERAKAALERVRHFSDLPNEVRTAIASAAAPRHFDTGQLIFLEGEPAEAIFILESGWVKATRMSRDGREQAMLVLQEGEVFGDIGVFTGQAYPGTVVALEPSDMWEIKAKDILDLSTRYPSLALAIVRRFGERVLYYVGLVEDLSLRSVEARLANTLLLHAEERQGQAVVPRRAWTTFDKMATRLGTVRDVLSRALHNLENEGLLQVEREEIVLLDPKGLEKRGNE